MENRVDFRECMIGFENTEKKDFENGVRLRVWSDVHEMMTYNDIEEKIDSPLFTFCIEFGKDKNKIIMIDAPIDDLELFASSILKQIEIIRYNYSNEIQKQIELGGVV